MSGSAGSTATWKPSPPPEHVPVLGRDAARRCRRRSCRASNARPHGAAPGLVVLESAVHAVERLARIGGDVVELADREVVDELPRGDAVEALEHAAVGAEQHVLAVRGIDPHRVAVRMQVARPARREGDAAVVRPVQVGAQQVDARAVVGLHADLAEVERARRERADALPAWRPRRRCGTRRRRGSPPRTRPVARPRRTRSPRTRRSGSCGRRRARCGPCGAAGPR